MKEEDELIERIRATGRLDYLAFNGSGDCLPEKQNGVVNINEKQLLDLVRHMYLIGHAHGMQRVCEKYGIRYE